MNYQSNRRKNQNYKKKVAGAPVTRIITGPFSFTPGHKVIKGDKDTQLKYIDYSQLGTNITAPATAVRIGPFNIMTQGVAQSQRIGDRVRNYSWEVRVNINAANSDVFSAARVLIVRWLEDTAVSTPGITDILQSTTALELSSYDFENYGRRFTILRDWIFPFTGTGTNPTLGSNLYHMEDISLNGTQIQFNPGATTGVGHYYMFLFSNSAVSPFPVLNLNSRLYYFDA